MLDNGAKIVVGAIMAVVLAIGLGAGAIYLVPSTTTAGSSLTNDRTNSTQTSQSSKGGILGPSATLNIYLTDAPPTSPQFNYLLVNVSSVTLLYTGNISTSAPQDQWVYTVPSASGTNVNLTKLVNNKALLGATEVPAGNVNEIIFSLNGAEAFFNDGSSSMLKVVANGELIIPIQFTMSASGTSNLTVDLTPNSIHLSHGNTPVLTPVVHVTVVQKFQSSTSVVTASSNSGETTISSSTISSSEASTSSQS